MTHPLMTEADFQRQVTDLADRLGWDWWRTPDSRRTNPGFPDLVLARGDVALFRELKTERGRVRPEQGACLLALRGAGIDAKVWRPKDWPEIEATLTAPRMVTT